jgi:hypothetical protein
LPNERTQQNHSFLSQDLHSDTLLPPQVCVNLKTKRRVSLGQQPKTNQRIQTYRALKEIERNSNKNTDEEKKKLEN